MKRIYFLILSITLAVPLAYLQASSKEEIEGEIKNGRKRILLDKNEIRTESKPNKKINNQTSKKEKSKKKNTKNDEHNEKVRLDIFSYTVETVKEKKKISYENLRETIKNNRPVEGFTKHPIYNIIKSMGNPTLKSTCKYYHKNIRYVENEKSFRWQEQNVLENPEKEIHRSPKSNNNFDLDNDEDGSSVGLSSDDKDDEIKITENLPNNIHQNNNNIQNSVETENQIVENPIIENQIIENKDDKTDDVIDVKDVTIKNIDLINTPEINFIEGNSAQKNIPIEFSNIISKDDFPSTSHENSIEGIKNKLNDWKKENIIEELKNIKTLKVLREIDLELIENEIKKINNDIIQNKNNIENLKKEKDKNKKIIKVEKKSLRKNEKIQKNNFALKQNLILNKSTQNMYKESLQNAKNEHEKMEKTNSKIKKLEEKKLRISQQISTNEKELLLNRKQFNNSEKQVNMSKKKIRNPDEHSSEIKKIEIKEEK